MEAFFAEVMGLAEKAGVAERRALLGRWHADQGLGEPQELPAQGRSRPDAGGGGRNAQADWNGKPRSNDTHESTTDPEARLLPQEPAHAEAILCYQGHVLMENAQRAGGQRRGESGQWVRRARERPGDARRAARDQTPEPSGRTRPTTPPSSSPRRARSQVTPHVAQQLTPSRRQRDRWAHHATSRAIESSQSLRKRVEEPFGWAKTVGRIRQTVFRGLRAGQQQFMLTMTANNLVRMRGLLAGAT